MLDCCCFLQSQHIATRCCCLWQTTVQEKSPSLRRGLSIRGHQKVISDFIRYQPTQLPLRAHIAVTPYGSHSFPCVSQSLWAQGHQLGERKIAWDPELDFCLGSDLAPRNMPTKWLQELYTQCSVTGGCPRELYCNSRDQRGPANTPASQHQLWTCSDICTPQIWLLSEVSIRKTKRWKSNTDISHRENTCSSCQWFTGSRCSLLTDFIIYHIHCWCSKEPHMQELGLRIARCCTSTESCQGDKGTWVLPAAATAEDAADSQQDVKEAVGGRWQVSRVPEHFSAQHRTKRFFSLHQVYRVKFTNAKCLHHF